MPQGRHNGPLITLSWLFVLLSTSLHAQEAPHREIDPQRLADEIFPIQNIDLSYQELYDNFLQMLAHPIDLNKATAEELRALYLLREEQVETLMDHRKENGPLLSIYELQSVPGFDSASVNRLLPFVRVIDANTTWDRSLLNRIALEKNNYLITRYERVLEKKKGYKKETDSSARYAGSPDKFLMRFREARYVVYSFC